MPPLQLQMTINVNRIYIVSSIRPEDYQTARHLHEDLMALHVAEQSPEIHFNQVDTCQELQRVLHNIKRDCDLGAVVPILHIECHGDQDSGLKLASGESASWQWFVNRCREINISCGYSLGLVLAACFGLYVIKPIKLEARTPFAYVIASDSEVSAGSIGDKMVPFYRNLFETASMDSALAILGEEFKPFYAEKFLVVTLAKYIRRGCMGRARDQRREDLISDAISRGVPNTKANRKAMRKLFKDQVTPRPALLHKYAERFLGRRCSVSFPDLMSFVSESAT